MPRPACDVRERVSRPSFQGRDYDRRLLSWAALTGEFEGWSLRAKSIFENSSGLPRSRLWPFPSRASSALDTALRSFPKGFSANPVNLKAVRRCSVTNFARYSQRPLNCLDIMGLFGTEIIARLRASSNSRRAPTPLRRPATRFRTTRPPQSTIGPLATSRPTMNSRTWRTAWTTSIGGTPSIMATPI